MSLKTDPHRIRSLKEQRARVQRLEKQVQVEYDVAKKVLGIQCKADRDSCFVGRFLPKPGPTLESKVEREQRRLCELKAQHNELKFTERGKERRLLEMQQNMKSLEMDTAPNKEDEKHVQLENILENIILKITEAKKIHSTYLRVREHLQQEGREMSQDLDKLQSSVLRGQTELNKVAMMLQSALAALDSTKSALLREEQRVTALRRAAKQKLREAQVARAREVEARVEREKEGKRRRAQVPNRAKEQGRKVVAWEVLAELTNPAAVIQDQHSMAQFSIPQSVIKLIDDIDALKDAVSCTDQQELETLLVSQNATEKQLLSHMAQCEEPLERRTKELEAVELQYAQLKFSSGQQSEWYERLKAGLEEELVREQEQSDQWERKLVKAETLLHILEQSIDNLYYRTSCLAVKELPQESSLDVMDKLKEIRARLACLGSTSPQPVNDSSLDHEKMWGFLVKSTILEPKNCKCVSSPVRGSTSKEVLQFDDTQEDWPPSRDEMKRRSLQVIEAHRPRKKVQKRLKKS